MKKLGNIIYWFGVFVAATLLGIGIKNLDAPALKRDAEEDWARYTALRKKMEELEGLDTT